MMRQVRRQITQNNESWDALNYLPQCKLQHFRDINLFAILCSIDTTFVSLRKKFKIR